MSYQRSAKQKIVAKQRRDQDRQLARIERERRAQRARRLRAARRAAVVVAALAVLTGIGFGVRAWVEAGRRGPANMASDGLLFIGDGTEAHWQTTPPLPDGGTPTPTIDLAPAGVTQVVVYLDYADPTSAAFWAANGAAIEDAVSSGSGTTALELHPVALDGAGARAANAFACVASLDPDAALAVNSSLLAGSGAADLSDEELVATALSAGADAGVEGCIRDDRYGRWVDQATERAALAVPFDGLGGVSATPLVVAGGEEYTGAADDAEAFSAFLADAVERVTAAAATS